MPRLSIRHVTWAEISPMLTCCQGRGSLPPKPGRFGLRTRQPIFSARFALSRQYIVPPAKYPWTLTAQIGGEPGPSGPWACMLSETE